MAGAFVARKPGPTQFRKFYERGDFPIALDHDTKGNKISWKVWEFSLDYNQARLTWKSWTTITTSPFFLMASVKRSTLMSSSLFKAQRICWRRAALVFYLSFPSSLFPLRVSLTLFRVAHKIRCAELTEPQDLVQHIEDFAAACCIGPCRRSCPCSILPTNSSYSQHVQDTTL